MPELRNPKSLELCQTKKQAPMKRSILTFLVALGFASLLVQRADAQTTANQTSENQGVAMQGTDDKLIAIDVLLEPDGTTVEKSNAVNARLRGNYPDGYALDATHAPHVTLLQRFVRVKDLDAVTAALTKVFASERPTQLPLTAKGHEYGNLGRSGRNNLRCRTHAGVEAPTSEGHSRGRAVFCEQRQRGGVCWNGDQRSDHQLG